MVLPAVPREKAHQNFKSDRICCSNPLLNSRLRGFLLTVNTLGLSWTLRETIRRVFGIGYTWRSIRVDSASLFRLLRKLVFNRYDVYGSGEEVVVKTYLARLASICRTMIC